jgi:formylglycine-generating enzyme required for sulfatase activity
VVGFNVQLAHGSESPVDALPPSPAGFYDTFGNVWEWWVVPSPLIPNLRLL